MDQLNRRAIVREILRGAAVVGVGLALPPGAAEAMPIDASPAEARDGLIEDVQWHGNNWHGNNWQRDNWQRDNWNRRRGRRWVCWWNRGHHRVCGWR
jgi:hypothetical protein